MNWKSNTLLILMFSLAIFGCENSDNNADKNNGGGIIVKPDAGGGPDTPNDAGDDGDDRDAGDDGDSNNKPDPNLDAKSDPDPDGAGSTPDISDDSDASDYVPFDTSRPDTSGPGVSGSCENIVDLGTLQQGTQLVQVVYDRTNNDNVRTSCRNLEADTKPEKVFKFQVAEPGTKVSTLASANYTFELRKDPCGEESSVLTCNRSGRLSHGHLNPGQDVYLIVEDEAELDEDSFDPALSENFFELSVEGMLGTECTPGVSECSQGDVRICNPIGSFETQACPTSCTEDGAHGSCTGDTCQNPILLTNNAATLQGSIEAFGNKIPSYACGSSSAGGGNPGNTSQPNLGQETVFMAENLDVGQTIKVQATGDDFTSKIVIQRGACGAGAVCAHVAARGESSVNYEVDEAGSYYIIIDAYDVIFGNIDYQVTVE